MQMDSRRMCPHCRAFITIDDRICPYCHEEVGPRAADIRHAGSVIGGFIPRARFNTMLILLINAGLYIATVIFSMKAGRGNGMDLDSQTLIIFGAKVGLGFLHGQWWRLVTAGFLHGGLFHILMNSWVLFDLGAQVEEIYGPSRMWVIYFLGSCSGFLLSAWWNPAPSIGASAGLCGLIGAMIALGVRHRNPMGQAIRGMYVRWAVYILLMGLLPFFNIDNAAHMGGLVGGFCIGYIAETPGRQGSSGEGLWRAAAWFCVILTVVSFVKWWMWFSLVLPEINRS
jgi:rhomboid protease GluP